MFACLDVSIERFETIQYSFSRSSEGGMSLNDNYLRPRTEAVQDSQFSTFNIEN